MANEAGPAALGCSKCGYDGHYDYDCPNVPMSDGEADEEDTSDVNVVIRLPGGVVKLPPGFVNESAAGMESLTAELLSDAAQRRERNDLAQSSASRAKPPTRGNSLLSQSANVSIATVNAMAQVGAPHLAALTQAARNSSARKYGGKGQSSLPSATCRH